MTNHRARCVVTLFALIGLAALPTLGTIWAQSPQGSNRAEIKAVLNGKNTYIEISGLPESVLTKIRARIAPASDFARYFVVATEEAAASVDVVAMLGSYSIEHDSIRFQPRFPLVAGQKYVARFDLPGFLQMLSEPNHDARMLQLVFSLPETPTEVATTVAHIYPSSNELPENQLKFYIHFSAPMSFGEAYDHIHLLDEHGNKVERPFYILDQELWDSTHERFTLLFDPGRIKRGLRSNADLGLALEQGRKYRLVIDNKWRDATGHPLASGSEKSFVVGPAVRTTVNYRKWRVVEPTAQTMSQLKLVFDRPLDHSLLERAITIFDSSHQRIEGKIEILTDETELRFTPSNPWKSGPYDIRIDTALEDLAGNNLIAPFDVDLANGGARPSTTKYVTLSFQTVRPTHE